MALFKSNGKFGYVNHTGKEVIPAKFDFASGFLEKLALIEENGKFGFINTKGEIVIKPEFEFASAFKRRHGFNQKRK